MSHVKSLSLEKCKEGDFPLLNFSNLICMMLKRHLILLKWINVEIWPWNNVEIWRCFNVEIWRCFNVETWHCFNVEIWRCLKQHNRYLSVIIVCGYFSLIRSLTWLNFLSKSNSYHKTSLSMSFDCWHLSGIPLCPLHFTVYTIARQRKFEPQWVFNINLCIVSG